MPKHNPYKLINERNGTNFAPEQRVRVLSHNVAGTVMKMAGIPNYVRVSYVYDGWDRVGNFQPNEIELVEGKANG